MDVTALNSYVGRAKNIKHVISWTRLKAEMKAEGATPEEIAFVARHLQKGEAKEVSYINPAKSIDLRKRLGVRFMYNIVQGNCAGDMEFDSTTNTLTVREVQA